MSAEGQIARGRAGESTLQGPMSEGRIEQYSLAKILVFNTVLGEELLFRGMLLPRMKGALGRLTGLPTVFCSQPTTCTCRG